ncbi:unnamed protein product [Aphanomyces euteiches]
MPMSLNVPRKASWHVGAKKMTLSVSNAIRDAKLLPTKTHPLRYDEGRAGENTPVLSPVDQTPPTLTSASVTELRAGELDPLSALMSSFEIEPVKKTYTNDIKQDAKAFDDTRNDYLDEWTAQKHAIFHAFAAEKFQIKVHANEDEGERVRFVDDPNPVMQRARARLELLEKKKEVESTTVEISQGEYINRIKALQNDFLNAWHEDQKVLALRITIKCIKLLGDSSFPKFYPCMFVLVSDVLDCFGTHVFNRIKAKADEQNPLSNNFTSADVSIEAKETCRNCYTEIALLRCYRFLCDGEYPHIVLRLSNMIKGVADPTVALYTRTYLALASSRVLTGRDTAILQSMQDYMYIMHRFSVDKALDFYSQYSITEPELQAIHAPGVEWLMKNISIHATEKDVDSLLYQYKQYADNSMILEQILVAFPGALLAKHAMGLVQLIQQTTRKDVLFRRLSLKLVDAPPPPNEKLVFLNEVWGTITRLVDIQTYLKCAADFVALLVTHYSSREVVILLKDVVRHLNSAETMDAALYQALESIMEIIILEARRQTHYFTTIIPSNEFLTLLGMFQHSTNITLSKRLLHAFVRGKDKGLKLAVEGPHAAIVHILLSICIRVHDSLDYLSSSLETHEASLAISTFVLSLDVAAPGQEEGLLQMYVECRRVFYKLDKVKACLIRRVLWLSLLAEGRRSFVKGCLAYCHITIPSLSDSLERLQLMTLCAKIALASHCIPQMDAFVKAAIVLITELPSPTTMQRALGDDLEESSSFVSPEVYESHVIDAMSDLLSLLVVVPSVSPEDPLYFIHGFRNAIEKFPWRGTRIPILIQLVRFLATWVPDEPLPYTIGHVAANDVLFGGSPILQDSLNEQVSSVIEEITKHLQDLNQDKSQFNIQCDLVLDLVNALAASVELNAFASTRLVKLMTGVAEHQAILHGKKSYLPRLMYLQDDIKLYWRSTKAFLLRSAEYPPSALSPKDAASWHSLSHNLHGLQIARGLTIGPSYADNGAAQRPSSPRSSSPRSPQANGSHPRHHVSTSLSQETTDHLVMLLDHSYGDEDNQDPHRHFFQLLHSNKRSMADDVDLHEWLARESHAAYVALRGLSRGNDQCFHDILHSMSIVERAANDFIVRQDQTPTGSVFIVLSGRCTEVIKRHRFNLTRGTSTSTPDDDLAWRTLHPGDLFGLESIYFDFPFHFLSLRSDGCVKRNSIGVSTVHPTCLLVVPHYTCDKTNGSVSPMVCPFDTTAAAFLEQLALFRSLPRTSIEFLASHLTTVTVHMHEYLYTAGQPPAIYLVVSGELRVYTVEDVVLATDESSEVVTRRVELEILKPFNCTGLAEVCLNSAGFANYCVATAPASVYILPTYALFAVAKTGMPILDTFVDYFTRQTNWYKRRRFTALNQYNKRVEYL